MTSNTREELLTQMTELFRAIPHKQPCQRQPPFEGNISCACDVGKMLELPGTLLLKIILEVTEV